jgi:hypothetical protein
MSGQILNQVGQVFFPETSAGMAALRNILDACKNDPGSGFNSVFDSQRVTRLPGKIAMSFVDATEQCSHISEQSPSMLSLRAPAKVGQVHQPLVNCFFVRAILPQHKGLILADMILDLSESEDASTVNAVALQAKSNSSQIDLE